MLLLLGRQWLVLRWQVSASCPSTVARGPAVHPQPLAADTQAQFEHLNQATTIVRSKYEEVADHAVEVSALRREVAEDGAWLQFPLAQPCVARTALPVPGSQTLH